VGQHFPYRPLDAAQLQHASCILSPEGERHVTHTLWCTWRKSYFDSTALASITSVFTTFMSIIDVRCSMRVSVTTRLPCGTNTLEALRPYMNRVPQSVFAQLKPVVKLPPWLFCPQGDLQSPYPQKIQDSFFLNPITAPIFSPSALICD
jgi:hypothetical protein